MAHQPNSSLKSPRLGLNQAWSKQKGAALILIAFILGLGAAVFVLKTYNADTARARQDEKTYKALAEAKQALIAWAVNHPNTPGLMPYPDRNGDSNYDDTSDCYASNVNFAPNFTIGRLPLFKSDPNCVNAKSTVKSGLAGDFRDSSGERLWYEVSQNLLHDYKNNGDPNGTSPIINPSIINTPTNEWFVVVDRSGKVLSDRVAAVIIAPGAPVGNQDRSSGIADANQYLDKVVMASGKNYKNYTYYDSAIPLLKQEFIVGDDMRLVSEDDPTYKNQTVEPYYFNDKLVYITADELMAAIEKRAAAEVKTAIKNYKLSTSYNPYASILGGNKNYSCVVGMLAGALPIAAPHTSSCTYTGVTSATSNSSCSFADVDSIIFTKTGANFNGSSGACQFNRKVCTCSGAGTCTRAAQSFSCDSAGLCSANISGTYKFSGGVFDSVTSKCTSSCGTDITCSGIGGGAFSHSSCTDSPFNDVTTNSKLPIWFTTNLWQNYIYYTAQRGASPTLSAGGRSGITAIAITTGYPVPTTPFTAKGAAQVRLSCNLSDNLDTNINVTGNATGLYESLNKPRSPNYNDQIFVISP